MGRDGSIGSCKNVNRETAGGRKLWDKAIGCGEERIHVSPVIAHWHGVGPILRKGKPEMAQVFLARVFSQVTVRQTQRGGWVMDEDAHIGLSMSSSILQ